MGSLTRDVKPQRGGARLHGDHAHNLRHPVVLHDGEVVEGLLELQGQRRGGGPADPLDVQPGARRLLRTSVVRGFDLEGGGTTT